MLLDIPMYIMNTQNVHTCTHSHRILVYFVFFFLSSHFLPLAHFTTVSKL